METILKREDQPEVNQMIEYVKSLSKEEKQRMSAFLAGVQFAKQTAAKAG